jgi:hypothetical protein
LMHDWVERRRTDTTVRRSPVPSFDSSASAMDGGQRGQTLLPETLSGFRLIAGAWT